MRSLRILVVEDDPAIGPLLAEMLDSMGHSVCGVETTEEAAVNAALLASPHLMIVDARLGNGSGVVAVETISKTRAIPHIFVSGERMSVGRPSAIVLQKPFSQRELAHAIERATDASAQADSLRR